MEELQHGMKEDLAENTLWIKAIVASLSRSIDNVGKNGFGTVTVQITFKNGQIEYFKISDEIVTHKQEMATIMSQLLGTT